MASPTIDQFLGEISRLIREGDGPQLQSYLVIEPPYGNLYQVMIKELRQTFPKGEEEALEAKCSSSIPETQGGGETASWTAFTKFMVQYFVFLRDVDIQNLLETYNLLNELVQKINSALGHGSLGVLVLPTVVSYSQMLAKLAIGLDKQPELIAHLNNQSTEEGAARETLPERAANIMRQAFVTCLNDRSGDPSASKDGRPQGKKVGIYKIANLCLKVLFQCRKSRNAEQMFSNIENQAPLLSAYPRSQRVTYLYYLGRFYFASNHFWRTQLCLQKAYDECCKQCPTQRRLISIYLIASNIILGRFPSQSLLQRSEAQGLADKFLPLCHSIRKGDFASFLAMFDLKGPNPVAEWLLHYRIYMQLRNRCEVLVWRSLFRKTFLLEGFTPAADSKTAPTVALTDVLRAVKVLRRKATGIASYHDPDLEAVEDIDQDEASSPDMLEIESMASSLLNQGLLNGFVSHRLEKFAIVGAKKTSPLTAGFPNVWQAIGARSSDHVPGLVKNRKSLGGTLGEGTVVNLSGARPAGSAP